jgi:hypothetical protein
MIGGTIDIHSLSGDNLISFEIEKDQPIFKLFYKMNKHISSMIDKNYIEYKLLEDTTILDRTSTKKIQEIKGRITYVLCRYKLQFKNLEELIEYINENDTINDYNIYYYIMYKMIYGDLEELHQELSDNIQLKNLLLNKIKFDITTMKFTLGLTEQERILFERINNKNFILKAIQIDYIIFYFISDELKKDKNFILKAIKINFGIFQFVDDELKNDKNFILDSIRINFHIFFYVNNELKNDKDFILKAIQIDSKIFKYINDELKDDKKLILDGLKIISEYSRIILFEIIQDKFKQDKDFMLEAIKIDPYLMSKALELNKNKKFILSAIKIDPISFYYADYDRNDKEFIKEAIKIDPKTFFYVFPNSITELESSSQNIIQNLKNNREFILNSMKIDIRIYDYATSELKKDITFIEEANKIIEDDI